MNPIGAALLACAAAGCAWSAWVSLRGRWRVVVITVSAALAVIVPAVQLGGSPTTTERVSPPAPEPVGTHEPAPAPTGEVTTVEAQALPAVAEPTVDSPAPSVQAELAVAPVAEEPLPVDPDDDVERAVEEVTPVPTIVQPPAQYHLDATPQTAGAVEAPATTEAPTALRTAAKAPAAPRRSSGHKHKNPPPKPEHPKKAKPEPKGQRQHH
jgi:hypothetical protein